MGSSGAKTPEPTQEERDIFKKQLELMDLEAQRIREEFPLRQQELALRQQQLDALKGQGTTDPVTGEVTYDGQIAQQIQIQQQQLDLAQQALEDQASIRPFVLQSLGLQEDASAPGGLRRMTEDELQATYDDAQRLGRQNLLLALEREQRALKGELPVSEGLRQRKEQDFKTFKEAMARAGNPITGDTPETAVAQTTAGAQGLKAFNQQYGYLEDIERRGELSELAQTNISRVGAADYAGAQRRASLLDFPRSTGVLGGAVAGGGAGATGGGGYGDPTRVAAGYGGLLEPLEAQRGLEYQGALAQQQQQQQRRQALGSAAGAVVGGLIGTYIAPGAGTYAGAALGSAAGGAAGSYISDPKMKKDIRPASHRTERKALEMVRDMKTHTFRMKDEARSAPKRVGVMSPALPRGLTTPDRKAIDVGRMMGVLTAAVRELDRKVEAKHA